MSRYPPPLDDDVPPPPPPNFDLPPLPTKPYGTAELGPLPLPPSGGPVWTGPSNTNNTNNGFDSDTDEEDDGGNNEPVSLGFALNRNDSISGSAARLWQSAISKPLDSVSPRPSVIQEEDEGSDQFHSGGAHNYQVGMGMPPPTPAKPSSISGPSGSIPTGTRVSVNLPPEAINRAAASLSNIAIPVYSPSNSIPSQIRSSSVSVSSLPTTSVQPISPLQNPSHRATLPSPSSSQSPTFSPVNRSIAGSISSGKQKCADEKCMSFAVRGNWCLRHVWKEEWRPAVDGQQMTRQLKVAQELITTERSYCDSLKTVTKVFQQRLQAYLDLQAPLMKREDLAAIFNNLTDIYQLSEAMINDLEEIQKEGVLLKQLGATLLHHSPQFRIYQPYLENYDQAIKKLQLIRKENKDLDLFLRVNEQIETLSLQSFLIMPVQRLPRYLMLLQELIKNTDTEHPGYPDMNQAKERISRIADAINQSLHVKEGTVVVQQIQDQFERDSRFEEFAAPGRYLVKEGPLKKRFSKFSKHLSSSKSYHFFLFNDLLIYADASKNMIGKGVTFRMKHLVPLLDMEVNDGQKGKDGRDLELKNSVTGKHFSLIFDSDQLYNDWKSAIVECIRKLRETHKDMKIASYDGSLESDKKPKNMSKFKNMMGIDG